MLDVQNYACRETTFISDYSAMVSLLSNGIARGAMLGFHRLEELSVLKVRLPQAH